jgi:hypothetical protein
MGRSFTPQGGAGTPLEGQELLSAFLCPPLSASVNNYTVAARSFANASVLYLGATTPLNITGLQGATPNRELTLINVTANAITLKNANGASLAANRFNFDSDVVLNQWDGIKLLGSPPGAAGWVAVSAVPTGGGGAPATATFITATDQTGTLPNSVIWTKLFSGVSVAQSADQNLPNSVTTALSFDTSLYDTDGYHSDSVNPTRLTAPATGIYHVTANTRANNAAPPTVYYGLAKNGTGFISPMGSLGTPTTADGASVSIAWEGELAAGDYIEFTAFVTGSFAINNDHTQTSFTMSYRGALPGGL